MRYLIAVIAALLVAVAWAIDPPRPQAPATPPPPARFNPTEKVRADFPVSFPIDI